MNYHVILYPPPTSPIKNADDDDDDGVGDDDDEESMNIKLAKKLSIQGWNEEEEAQGNSNSNRRSSRISCTKYSRYGSLQEELTDFDTQVTRRQPRREASRSFATTSYSNASKSKESSSSSSSSYSSSSSSLSTSLLDSLYPSKTRDNSSTFKFTYEDENLKKMAKLTSATGYVPDQVEVPRAKSFLQCPLDEADLSYNKHGTFQCLKYVFLGMRRFDSSHLGGPSCGVRLDTINKCILFYLYDYAVDEDSPIASSLAQTYKSVGIMDTSIDGDNRSGYWTDSLHLSDIFEVQIGNAPKEVQSFDSGEKNLKFISISLNPWINESTTGVGGNFPEFPPLRSVAVGSGYALDPSISEDDLGGKYIFLIGAAKQMEDFVNDLEVFTQSPRHKSLFNNITVKQVQPSRRVIEVGIAKSLVFVFTAPPQPAEKWEREIEDLQRRRARSRRLKSKDTREVVRKNTDKDGEIYLSFQRIPIYYGDLHRLEDGVYLNDALIDFKIKQLVHRYA